MYRSSHATPHREGRHLLPQSMPRASAAARGPARGSGEGRGSPVVRAEAAARGWGKPRCPYLPAGAAIAGAHPPNGSGIRADVSRETRTHRTRRLPSLPRPNLRASTSRSSRSACTDGHRALGRVAWTDRPRARLAAITSIHSPSTATIAPVLGHTNPVCPSPSAPATTARGRDGVPTAATEWDAARRPCAITYPGSFPRYGSSHGSSRHRLATRLTVPRRCLGTAFSRARTASRSRMTPREVTGPAWRSIYRVASVSINDPEDREVRGTKGCWLTARAPGQHSARVGLHGARRSSRCDISRRRCRPCEEHT